MNDERQAQPRVQRLAFGVQRCVVCWAFARFYREFAWTYDTVAALVSGGQWRLWTLAALPYLRGRVLELGCGTGNLQLALASGALPKATGVDLSPQMLARTRAKLARDGATARLVRGDARALPFSSATFDTVVATFPSEYIAAGETLNEVRRLLRPGGQLVIILAAQFVVGGLYQQAIDLLYRLTLQRPVLASQPTDHPPASSLGAQVGQAGFATREIWDWAGGRNVRLHVIIGSVV